MFMAPGVLNISIFLVSKQILVRQVLDTEEQ